MDKGAKGVGDHTLAHPAKDCLRREDHVLLNRRILLYLSVDPRHQRCRRSLLRKDAGAHEDGADRRELVKRLGVEELPAGLLGKLEEAAREVVADCVAEDVLGGFVGRDVAALARGYEDQLALVSLLTAIVSWGGRVSAWAGSAHLPVGQMRGAEATDGDGFVWRCERGGRLGPYRGVGGDIELLSRQILLGPRVQIAYICFPCMAPVVESDAVDRGTCFWQRRKQLSTVLSAA